MSKRRAKKYTEFDVKTELVETFPGGEELPRYTISRYLEGTNLIRAIYTIGILKEEGEYYITISRFEGNKVLTLERFRRGNNLPKMIEEANRLKSQEILKLGRIISNQNPGTIGEISTGKKYGRQRKRKPRDKD